MIKLLLVVAVTVTFALSPVKTGREKLECWAHKTIPCVQSCLAQYPKPEQTNNTEHITVGCVMELYEKIDECLADKNYSSILSNPCLRSHISSILTNDEQHKCKVGCLQTADDCNKNCLSKEKPESMKVSQSKCEYDTYYDDTLKCNTRMIENFVKS